jgi:hypothetical protein
VGQPALKKITALPRYPDHPFPDFPIPAIARDHGDSGDLSRSAFIRVHPG